MQVFHELASEWPVIEKDSDLDHLGIKFCLMASYIKFPPPPGWGYMSIVVNYKHKYIFQAVCEFILELVTREY